MTPEEPGSLTLPADNGRPVLAPVPGVPSVPAPAVPAAATPGPMQADDTDVLEDAWIDVVERIVKEQQHDPYLLNRSMTLARADYLKKRYNREVKIPD